MLKFLLDLIFVAGLALITFFGIGPVIFADGSSTERMISLAVVLAIYFGWIALFRVIRRKRSR